MQDDPLIGTHLGHFKVDRVIAVGGMGVIYQATHSVIGRTAAIKVLSEKYSSDKSMIKRLHREARAVNQIGHPNIIDIFDFGQTPDRREYFVMEYLPGQSLAQLMEHHGRLPWQLISPLISQMLDALAAAHDQGIIHRDMKPENILVVQHENGEITTKILDFGIAKSVGLGPEGERLTRAGVVLGTPEYIAPEQIRGKEVDGRADLYGVGVMLFEMVMGKRPFDAEQVVSLLMLHLKEPVPRMDDIPQGLGIPDYVPAVVNRALAKTPDQRFPDARTFARALQLATNAPEPADGTRPLPELMWETNAAHSPTAAMGTQPTEPGVGPGVVQQDPGRAPTAQMSSKQGTLAGAGPPPLAIPVTAPGPAMPTGTLPGEEAPTRSPLIWILPLAAVLLGGAGVALYFALKPAPGPATQPVVVTETPDAGTPKPKAIDLEELLFKLKKTLRGGAQGNKDPEVRARCVAGIGVLREDDAFSVLSQILRDEPEEKVRRAVAMAIAQLGDPAGAGVLREARGRSTDLGKVGVDEALTRMGHVDGRVGLKDALEAKEQTVRFAAALALGESHDHDAIPVLTKMAGEPLMIKSGAFVTVTGILARLGHQDSYVALEKALSQKQALLKLNAAKAMAKLGEDRGVDTLKSILRGDKPELQLAAAAALASVDDATGLETLIKGAQAKDAASREIAAEGLGHIVDRAVLPPLAVTLEDKEWPVKASAAQSLARILSQMPSALVRRSQDWIKEALENGEWSVRHAAVGLTEDMDPELAVSLLSYAFKDKSAVVRLAAVKTAARMKKKTKAVMPWLRNSLFDPDAKVRAAAAEALGGDREAKEYLEQALRDKSVAVRFRAAGALLAMGETKYVRDLRQATKSKNPTIRRAAILALAKGKAPKPTLKKALTDKSGKVRLAAALELSKLGDKSGEAELRAAVKRGGAAMEVATKALARLGIKPTQEVIQGMAKSKKARSRRRAMSMAPLAPTIALGVLKRGTKDQKVGVRLAAAKALTKMATKNAGTIPLLRRLARDPNPMVRAKASIGLAKAVRAHSALSKMDRGKVKGVKEAPLPAMPKVKPRPLTPKEKERPLFWVDVNSPAERYKYQVSRATVAFQRGRHGAALAHLKRARKIKDTGAVRCEMGQVYFKIAFKHFRGKQFKNARRNLANAKKNYRDCARRGRTPKLRKKAAAGKRDVKRLSKLIR